MKRSFLAVLAAAAVLIPAAAQANVAGKYGIAITSCVVNQGGNGLTNGVNIVYANTHPSPATAITFVVGYRGQRYTIVDTGTFSQGAQINHNLTGTLVGLPWSGPSPNSCTVRRVVLANGRVFAP